MAKAGEPTVGFSVWPVLLMLEGPSTMIGIALTAIYNDPRIDRAEWHCEHTCASRAEFAAQLRLDGKKQRRLGIGAKTQETASMIAAKATACGVKCVIFRGATAPTKAAR